MFESLTELINRLVYVPAEGMVHPGLSPAWVVLVVCAMLLIGVRAAFFAPAHPGVPGGINLSRLPLLGRLSRFLLDRPWVITGLRLFFALLFLLVIYAGLFGTPLAERNLSTMLTWTLWWSGVVISVFFVGSAWCAVCPWDAVATWIVRRRLWRRGSESNSLKLRVPKMLRSAWPALLMFVGLTWLELGMGVTTSPYATALLALLMVTLATVSLALYERKAFCRYFCAVGRTLGAYSALAPVALRPVDNETCADCTTLECYHGTADIAPCPTHLVMGRLQQNTYCTSCGACAVSCPHHNVGWRLRPVGDEITRAARPHWDEAWFILGLVSLTSFHGFTMMPYWEGWMRQLAYQLGDSGQLLLSFSIGMAAAMLAPILVYLVCIWATRRLGRIQETFHSVFSALALSTLPLAFSYHIAHNLSHLVRESHGFWSVLFNPLGTGTLPLSMQELHSRHMTPLIPDGIVFALQGTLILFGFWLAVRIARHRLQTLQGITAAGAALFLPTLLFVSLISVTNLWLLMQPMVMRM
jgi:polyferredoxin